MNTNFPYVLYIPYTQNLKVILYNIFDDCIFTSTCNMRAGPLGCHVSSQNILDFCIRDALL
jgi:hypothetical protein